MAKKGDEKPSIFIKKVKKVAGGHHGGAWKVAYADFVTAMMAFFMLLWLLSVSDKVTLQGLADYFTPSNSTMSNSSGSGSILAGTAMESEGAKSSGSVTMAMPSASPQKESEAEQASMESQSQSASSSWQTKLPPQPDAKLLQAEDDLKTAIQSTPELNRYKDQISMEQTPDGLRIQLVDRDQRPMFRPGTAELYPFAERMMRVVGGVIQGLPNRISIQGHTDSTGAQSESLYGNWELSADRANASRRALRSAGVPVDRFAEVTGRASTDPLYPDDPLRPENRRISVLIIREAPVMAPNFGATY